MSWSFPSRSLLGKLTNARGLPRVPLALYRELMSSKLSLFPGMLRKPTTCIFQQNMAYELPESSDLQPQKYFYKLLAFSRFTFLSKVRRVVLPTFTELPTSPKKTKQTKTPHIFQKQWFHHFKMSTGCKYNGDIMLTC